MTVRMGLLYINKIIFLLLTAVLFSGCSLVIYVFITSNPDFKTMTGDMTATDGRTLVFTYDKELVVFEYTNGRWRYHSRFSAAKLLRPTFGSPTFGINSIAVRGNIIAVGMKGAAWQNIKGVVGIYQRNLKNNGWSLLKVLRDPDPILKNQSGVRVNTSLFGSHVAVTENYVVATFLGPKKEEAGLYLYDCRSESASMLRTDEPTVISFQDINADAGIAPDEMLLYYYNQYRGGDSASALRALFLDEADALTNTNAMKRPAVFAKKGGDWSAVEMGDILRMRSNPDSEGIYRYEGNFVGNLRGMLVATIFYGVYAFEKNREGQWNLAKNYGLSEHLKGSLRRLVEVYEVAFGMGANETVAITTHFDEKFKKYRIGVHRKNESGWEMTDEITPEAPPQVRRNNIRTPLQISGDDLLVFNDMIVVETENPPYHYYDNVGAGDDAILDIIFMSLLDFDTKKLNRYPGRVCIYRLLPEKGYVLEDIIVRDRDKWGRLYFKSAVY